MKTKAKLFVLGEGLVELSFADSAHTDHMKVAPGGDAANITVMASRMGIESALIGRVGDDVLGRQLLDWWHRDNVNCDSVVIDPLGPTGLYLNCVDESGQHHLDYHRCGSAGSRLAVEDVDATDLGSASAVVTTGITMAISSSAAEASEAAFAAAVHSGTRRVLVVNHRARLQGDVARLRALAQVADIVFVSDEEVTSVFGVSSMDQLSDQLPITTELILTQGSAGATLRYNGLYTEQHAPLVRAVDTAGAGDAFAGAYLAFRLGGCDPIESLKPAVVASALSVTRRGCSLSYPTRREVTDAAKLYTDEHIK